MPVTIKNKSRSLITLELNTGDWLHLAPGETSRTLEDFEVRENRYLTKLVGRSRIGLTTSPIENSPTAPQKTKPDRSKKR